MTGLDGLDIIPTYTGSFRPFLVFSPVSDFSLSSSKHSTTSLMHISCLLPPPSPRTLSYVVCVELHSLCLHARCSRVWAFNGPQLSWVSLLHFWCLCGSTSEALRLGRRAHMHQRSRSRRLQRLRSRCRSKNKSFGHCRLAYSPRSCFD
jgi:hypothetical protein